MNTEKNVTLVLYTSQRTRYILLGLITLAVAWWWGSKSPLPQDLSYHNFADQRRILAITNGLDVLSNLAFLIVGIWGLVIVLNKEGQERRFLDPLEKIPYLVFFAGTTLVSVGSAYYHLSPNNGTLVWDRLPMTIGFVAFFISVIMERISIKVGLLALMPALIIGAATVFYWSWTESQGRGDLRPYAFVQSYPIFAVAAMMVLFPARYTGSINLLLVIVFYILAKQLESKDEAIFAGTGGIVSGHTLKHLSAAIAIAWFVRMVKNRGPIHRPGSGHVDSRHSARGGAKHDTDTQTNRNEFVDLVSHEMSARYELSADLHRDAAASEAGRSLLDGRTISMEFKMNRNNKPADRDRDAPPPLPHHHSYGSRLRPKGLRRGMP